MRIPQPDGSGESRPSEGFVFARPIHALTTTLSTIWVASADRFISLISNGKAATFNEEPVGTTGWDERRDQSRQGPQGVFFACLPNLPAYGELISIAGPPMMV